MKEALERTIDVIQRVEMHLLSSNDKEINIDNVFDFIDIAVEERIKLTSQEPSGYTKDGCCIICSESVPLGEKICSTECFLKACQK